MIVIAKTATITPTRSRAAPWRSATNTPAVASKASPRAENTSVASNAQAASASEAPMRRNCLKPNALATSGPGRERARDGTSGKRYGRKTPHSGANTAAAQQALVHAGKGHERQHLDADSHQKPPRVEMGELRSRAGELGALTTHRPQGDATESDPPEEADARPGPFEPSRGATGGCAARSQPARPRPRAKRIRWCPRAQPSANGSDP